MRNQAFTTFGSVADARVDSTIHFTNRFWSWLFSSFSSQVTIAA